MQLLVEVDGDQQLARQLARWSDRVQDVRPAFDTIATEIARWETGQFASQGRRASGGWAPLSPRYRAWKERHYPGKNILERTGRLRESLTQRPFGVERINAQTMEVGTGVPYSRFHQQGTGRMPRRRPLELTDQDRGELVKILQRFIVTGTPQ